MVIDLKSDRYEGRYHADGKFFTPVIDNHYSSLFEYSSSHMVHPEDREAHRALMNPADMEERLARAWPRGILSGVIRYIALDGTWREMETLLIGGPEYALPEHTVQFYLFDVRDMRSREEGMHTETTASTRRLRDMMPDLLSEAVFFTMAQEKMHDTEAQWCMIAIDIKHFKLFKDLNGRVKGEQLLIRFAERIHEVAEQTDGLAPYDFDNNSPGIEVEEYSENNSGLDPSDGRHAAEFAKAIPGIGAGMSRADTATADIVGKTENGSLTAYDVLIAGAEYTQAEFSIGGAVAKDLPKI